MGASITDRERRRSRLALWLGPATMAAKAAPHTRPITPLTWRQACLVLVGLVMLWPAVLNRAPFIFPDTASYIRSVDALAYRIAGISTRWSNFDVRVVAVGSPDRRVRQDPTLDAKHRSQVEAKPILSGRSVFYGLLAYLGAVTGSLWTVIIIQALFVGCVLLGFARHVVDPTHCGRFALAVIGGTGLLSLTPLSFYVSMVMPDVLTGTTVLAAAVLMSGWARERVGWRIFWFMVAAFGALAHSSHVLMLVGLALIALLARRKHIAVQRSGALAVLAAAALGLVGDGVFNATVYAMTGSAPIRPPFITARLIADGPGTRYLRDHCQPATFVICKYRDRLPVPSDDFLWRTDDKGVFKAIPIPEQRQLANEQGRFIVTVLADRPIEVFATTAKAVIRQAGAFGLSEFDASTAGSRDFINRLPADERIQFDRSAVAQGSMPVGSFTALVGLWSVLGLFAFIRLRVGQASAALRACATLLVLGWILNVAICGALSTPHDRYQARIIWLLALIALTAAAQLQWRTTETSDDAGSDAAAAGRSATR